MKIFLHVLPCLLFVFVSNAQSSFYNLSLQALNGQTVNPSNLRDKSIIVFTMDPAAPDTGQLNKLKAFVTNLSDSLMAVVVPVTDYNENNFESDSTNLQQVSLYSSNIFLVVSPGKKNEHPLVKWLTEKNQNGHFDFPDKIPGQAFIVNPNGILYASLMRPNFNSLPFKEILASGRSLTQ